MLATPNGADNLFLVTDASNIAIGAVLKQGTDGHRRPLGFFSRKLNTPQQKYSTFDRELTKSTHAEIKKQTLALSDILNELEISRLGKLMFRTVNSFFLE